MWVQTYSGERVELVNPDPKAINIKDIAHNTARINRFTGSLDTGNKVYSVALHQLFCADAAKRLKLSTRTQLYALLHDAHEAYTGDINSPMKQAINHVISMTAQHSMISPLAVIEGTLDMAIWQAVCGHLRDPDPFEKSWVKKIDAWACSIEANHFLKGGARDDWKLKLDDHLVENETLMSIYIPALSPPSVVTRRYAARVRSLVKRAQAEPPTEMQKKFMEAMR
jgi:uncharacterized protein